MVINLAAQAGVRYSSKNPTVYVDSNINGFFNLLNLKVNILFIKKEIIIKRVAAHPTISRVSIV